MLPDNYKPTDFSVVTIQNLGFRIRFRLTDHTKLIVAFSAEQIFVKMSKIDDFRATFYLK